MKGKDVCFYHERLTLLIIVTALAAPSHWSQNLARRHLSSKRHKLPSLTPKGWILGGDLGTQRKYWKKARNHENGNISLTEGLYLPKTEEPKDKHTDLQSIFYTIFKADVMVWFRFKNYWNVTFSRSGNIKATAFTFGLLFSGPMAHFSPFFKI